MAEKDITEKSLEAHNDVFADIVNNLLFGGAEHVKEDDLAQGRERSDYDGAAGIREQERDSSKFWKENNIRIAYFGLENETVPEDDMPFRVIGYDGAAYRDQISYYYDDSGKRHKTLARCPVVTLVLYLGYKTRWNRARTVYEALGERLDDRLRPYVHDYPINLFEIAFLTDEQVAGFKSDFRIVADYLVQMRKNQNYSPTPVSIRHMRETMRLMSVLTDDVRFTGAAEEIEEGDEPKNMCTVLEKVENRGRTEGRAEGRAEEIVEIGREMGFVEQEILARLQDRLNISAQKAWEYFQKYAK